MRCSDENVKIRRRRQKLCSTSARQSVGSSFAPPLFTLFFAAAAAFVLLAKLVRRESDGRMSQKGGNGGDERANGKERGGREETGGPMSPDKSQRINRFVEDSVCPRKGKYISKMALQRKFRLVSLTLSSFQAGFTSRMNDQVPSSSFLTFAPASAASVSSAPRSKRPYWLFPRRLHSDGRSSSLPLERGERWLIPPHESWRLRRIRIGFKTD